MNINELNRIKTINIEERVADVEAGTGTYREIHDKVFADEIIPVVDSYGHIVGISYDSKVQNLIDDNIAQVAFEKRYRGKDVMRYVMHALQLKATNAQVADIQEDDMGIRVVLENGEVVIIEERTQRNSCDQEDTIPIPLPSETEIPMLALAQYGGNNMTAVKKYLRDNYDHYLSGDYFDPNNEVDEDEGVIKVTEIHWGRKR